MASVRHTTFELVVVGAVRRFLWFVVVCAKLSPKRYRRVSSPRACLSPCNKFLLLLLLLHACHIWCVLARWGLGRTFVSSLSKQGGGIGADTRVSAADVAKGVPGAAVFETDRHCAGMSDDRVRYADRNT